MYLKADENAFPTLNHLLFFHQRVKQLIRNSIHKLSANIKNTLQV